MKSLIKIINLVLLCGIYVNSAGIGDEFNY